MHRPIVIPDVMSRFIQKFYKKCQRIRMVEKSESMDNDKSFNTKMTNSKEEDHPIPNDIRIYIFKPESTFQAKSRQPEMTARERAL
jgi:hypothetical protein